MWDEYGDRMMASLLGGLFFGIVFLVAAGSLASTLLPQLGRIGFLLRYGPVIGAELPQPRRGSAARRGPVRMIATSGVRDAAAA